MPLRHLLRASQRKPELGHMASGTRKHPQRPAHPDDLAFNRLPVTTRPSPG